MSNPPKPDHIIAVMGMTGAGKSTFIDVVTRGNGNGIGHTLKSKTSIVHPKRCSNADQNFVFVDTPGFDDTVLSDTEVLRMIADWLKESYDEKKHLAGIIYCHRIADNRMGSTALKNLRMFGKLCGDRAAERVILVSTMWDKVAPATAEERERELCDTFWKPMLDRNGKTDRFNNTFDRGWSIVRKLVPLDADLDPASVNADPVLLQEELSVLHKHLSETAAGAALYTALQQLLAGQKEILRRVRDDAATDPDLKVALDKEYKKVSKELESTFKQVKEMKVPLTRRIAALFSHKKTRAAAVEIQGELH